MSSISVLITSKDRRSSLDRALQSVYQQSVEPNVVVIDDGSLDGTSELVRKKYPRARLFRNERPLGVIAVRNQGFELTAGDYVLTLDDDAHLVNKETIASVPELFERDEVAVAALPIVDHIDGRRHPRPHPVGAEHEILCLPSFSGGACIVRRTDFLSAGGYAGSDRQGEESDLTIRLLNNGKVVRAAPPSLAIWHFPEHSSAERSAHLEAAACNRMLSAWLRSPSSLVAIQTAGITVNYALLGLKSRQLPAVAQGFARAWPAFRSGDSSREPVSVSAFRMHRRLTKSRAMPLAAVRRGLRAG